MIRCFVELGDQQVGSQRVIRVFYRFLQVTEGFLSILGAQDESEVKINIRGLQPNFECLLQGFHRPQVISRALQLDGLPQVELDAGAVRVFLR